MVQIQYRWRLDASRADHFEAAWLRATHVIRRTRAGCHGSMLLHGSQDRELVVATAFWDSEAAWQASQALGPADPQASAEMAAIAELVSTEIFEVVHDVFIPAGS